MFEPALRLVVRLLPLLAAMVASVAIGASTQSIDTAATTAENDGGAYPVLLASRSTGHGDALIAPVYTVGAAVPADTLDLLATAYPVESLDATLTRPAPAIVSREIRRGFDLPRPDRWTALLATLALGAFFFLRRIV